MESGGTRSQHQSRFLYGSMTRDRRANAIGNPFGEEGAFPFACEREMVRESLRVRYAAEPLDGPWGPSQSPDSCED
jgi:hypothetical protein